MFKLHTPILRATFVKSSRRIQMYSLISSSPSPYARKVRIALAEKCIPFQLKTEIPWDATTETPQFNPLEKLPVLILSDGKTAIYESRHIMDWLESKHPLPINAENPSGAQLAEAVEGATKTEEPQPGKPLLPMADNIDARLKTKEIEVVADGVCDALVLWIWETRREEDKQSAEWKARQLRKVSGGLRAVASWVEEARGGYLVGGTFGLADIAVGSMLGFINLRNPDDPWKTDYPHLKTYWEKLESRKSFKDTVPFPFEGGIKDKVV